MKCSYVCKKECYKQISFVSQPSHSHLLEVNAAPMEMSGWHSIWFTEIKLGRKKDSPSSLLLLSQGKPAFLDLIPWTLMKELWRYTSILSRWFVTKKLHRITVKFLCICVCSAPCLLFTLTTASLKNDPLICYWIFRQEDCSTQMRMLQKTPTSAQFLTLEQHVSASKICWSASRWEWLVMQEDCDHTRLWGMVPLGRPTVYC